MTVLVLWEYVFGVEIILWDFDVRIPCLRCRAYQDWWDIESVDMGGVDRRKLSVVGL